MLQIPRGQTQGGIYYIINKKSSLSPISLQNPELFMAMAKDNPDFTLAELAEAESAL